MRKSSYSESDLDFIELIISKTDKEIDLLCKSMNKETEEYRKSFFSVYNKMKEVKSREFMPHQPIEYKMKYVLKGFEKAKYVFDKYKKDIIIDIDLFYFSNEKLCNKYDVNQTVLDMILGMFRTDSMYNHNPLKRISNGRKRLNGLQVLSQYLFYENIELKRKLKELEE